MYATPIFKLILLHFIEADYRNHLKITDANFTVMLAWLTVCPL